jgi:1-deoxy-D-xylulose-5-phosphate reductoisomerase
MILLGSTGSIGTNTLEICRRYKIKVEALVAGNNTELLNRQIAEFKPHFVAVATEEAAKKTAHKDIRIGINGISEILEECRSTIVVNSLVGYAGLKPTLKAIEMGKHVALANKESLVVAGAFIDKSAITPIDSEHFGLWYLMNGRPVKHLYITASGGAFRDWSIEAMKDAGYIDALKHPNWSMGDKITIDSATMANKLFELLEARWLFDTDRIDAYIERKSLIHALVEFADGSTTAHLAGVDMKLPIAFAILGEVKENILPPLDLVNMGSISFEAIDKSRYPLWQIKDRLLKNPKSGTVLNAANEAAMEKFRKGECSFFGMCDIILEAYARFENRLPENIDDVAGIDTEVRRYISG